MNLKDSTLFSLIHDYLQIYLPKQRNLSPNTIKSYRTVLTMFVDFVKLQKRIPLQDVTFEMLTNETISAFLDWIENDKGCSVSTRNNRFASIRAFVKYASNRDIAVVATLKDIKKVPVKKHDKAEVIEYMSMDAISAIVDRPDISTPMGIRDRMFLILMYDLGARISEVLGIKLLDLRFGKTPTISVLGKGGKYRIVPIMETTAKYLQEYMMLFHKDAPLLSEQSLFYTSTHGELHPLSDRRIRYMLDDYGANARRVCIEVPKNVYPHMFRHSRAMHLYQNGMDLTLISQWLGHAHLETTKIYAHADTEHKRMAIAAATPENNPLFAKLNPERFTISDEDTLKRLVGLSV
jgi:site-specific recombinase XerD